MHARVVRISKVLVTAWLGGCAMNGPSSLPDMSVLSGQADLGGPSGQAVQRILFIGDSFTHGRYKPVRSYGTGGAPSPHGSAQVIDENYQQTGARAENLSETGPWGGIPAIFARLAQEAGLPYEVHIEAISATSLEKNYAAAPDVITRPGWSAVVLQELSTRPLPASLSMNATSSPRNFCASVQTIEAAVHAAAPTTRVYLYETWAPADLAQMLAGSYATNLALLTQAYHDVYLGAAVHDGHLAGVALAGDAWSRAWQAGVASPDPFSSGDPRPSLWYGLNATNDPMITAADEHHPSSYGAYLSALVLFQQITGTDVRGLGESEIAARDLGIPSALATSLQQVAALTVLAGSVPPAGDPCSLQ